MNDFVQDELVAFLWGSGWYSLHRVVGRRSASTTLDAVDTYEEGRPDRLGYCFTYEIFRATDLLRLVRTRRE